MIGSSWAFYLPTFLPNFGTPFYTIASHPETHSHNHCDPDFLKKKTVKWNGALKNTDVYGTNRITEKNNVRTWAQKHEWGVTRLRWRLVLNLSYGGYAMVITHKRVSPLVRTCAAASSSLHNNFSAIDFVVLQLGIYIPVGLVFLGDARWQKKWFFFTIRK